jgi:hypothetical protein
MLSLFINFSHHPQLAFKRMLLFPAKSNYYYYYYYLLINLFIYLFFDIKASLAASNSLSHKPLKYSET